MQGVHPLTELSNCFKSVSYGNTQHVLQEQIKMMFSRYPNFRPVVENIEFPGELRQNYLVLKGAIVAIVNGQTNQFPIKMIIPQGFPYNPPRVYLDMSLPLSLVQSKDYLGNQNAIKIPYLTNWTNSQNMRQNPNLTDMMGYITAVIASNPPVDGAHGGNTKTSGYFPPQQQNQPQSYNPYQQHSQYGQQPQQQQQQPQYTQQQPTYGAASTSHTPTTPTSENQVLIDKVDKISHQYTESSQQTLNKLVQSKVELYKNKQIIEEKTEKLRQQCGECDSNIQVLQQQNNRMEQFLAEQSTSQELNEDNIESLVYPKDAFSTKIIQLTSKENAYEDCLVALKKAYEKDQISLQDFLQNIRKLANKQFKATLKRNKIVYALSGSFKPT